MLAARASIFLLLQPMLTAVWARLLFAERLSPIQLAGMALVLAGVGWLSARGSGALFSSRSGAGRITMTGWNVSENGAGAFTTGRNASSGNSIRNFFPTPVFIWYIEII